MTTLEAALEAAKVLVDNGDMLGGDAELAAAGVFLDILGDGRSSLVWWVVSVVIAVHDLLVVKRLGGQDGRHDGEEGLLRKAVSINSGATGGMVRNVRRGWDVA